MVSELARIAEAVVGGGCACGAVRFEVARADAVADPARCGCAWCTRVGWRGASVPEEAFRLLAGWEALERVRGGHLSRLRCARCGVDAFAEGEAGVSVNLRCLDA